ncbi:MAG: ABC transporter permease [Candidatus Bathyarchaeia archaeon]
MLKILSLILHDKRGIFGISTLLFFSLIGIFAPYISPYDPFAIWTPNLPISLRHPLGTDPLGRDVLSQLIWGSRTSLIVSFTAALGIMGIGLTIGLISALSRPLVDEVLMRFTDVILYIPKLPLLIFFALILGRGFLNVVLVLSLTMWPQTARVIRSEVLSIKQRPFIDAAKIAGAGTLKILAIILPHIFPLILASILTLITWSLIYEASLGFLGLGDPSVMSWGTMFHYAFLSGAIYLRNYAPIIAPGLCITLIGVGMNSLISVLEEVVNPKIKEVRRWKPF